MPDDLAVRRQSACAAKGHTFPGHGSYGTCSECGLHVSPPEPEAPTDYVRPPRHLTFPLYDPGAFVARRHDIGPEKDEAEPLNWWQARAVEASLSQQAAERHPAALEPLLEALVEHWEAQSYPAHVCAHQLRQTLSDRALPSEVVPRGGE